MTRLKRDEKGLRVKYGICKTCLSEPVRINHFGECGDCLEKARTEAIQAARIAVHKTYSNIAWPARLAKTHAGGASWRIIAEAVGKDVTAADVYRYAGGKEPKDKKKRLALGLPALAPAPVCPDHGGVDCLKCGGAHAGKPKPTRKRPRLVAQVTEAEKAAIRDAARAAGMTEAQWIRVRLGLEG